MNMNAVVEFSINIVHEIGIGIVFLIVGLSFQKIRKIFYRRKFKRAFGFVVESGNGFAISVPLWTLKRNEREIPRFIKTNTWNDEKEEYYGPTETFSADDISASNEISAILSEIFPQPALIIPDRDRLQLEDRTILMIGSPISNFHARSIFQEDFFQMGANRPFIFKEKIETTGSPSRTYIFSNRSGRKYHSDGAHDIAVVQRLKNPSCENGYLFIIAACHAEGTIGSAGYLRKNWGQFSKQTVGSTVGVLLKVDRNNPENATVLEGYPDSLKYD